MPALLRSGSLSPSAGLPLFFPFGHRRMRQDTEAWGQPLFLADSGFRCSVGPSQTRETVPNLLAINPAVRPAPVTSLSGSKRISALVSQQRLRSTLQDG